MTLFSCIHRAVSHILGRALRHLRFQSYGVESSRQQELDALNSSTKKLKHLKQIKRVVEKEIERAVEKAVKTGADEIRKHFTDQSIVDKICKWQEQDCPDSVNMDKVEALLFAFGTKRIRVAFNQWEKESGSLRELHSDILKVLRDHISGLEDEIEKVENEFLSEVRDLRNVSGKDDFLLNQNLESTDFVDNKQAILEQTSQIWKPASGLLSYFIRIKPDRGKQLKEYRSKKVKVMTKFTENLLKEMTAKDELNKLMNERMEGVRKTAKNLITRLETIIKGDEKAMKNLQRYGKTTSQNNIFSVMNQLQDIQCDLYCLYLNDLRCYDIGEQELQEWSRKSDQPSLEIGHVKLFKATLAKPRCAPKPCAVRVMLPITRANALSFAQEEDKIR